jgi:hypothetical protein
MKDLKHPPGPTEQIGVLVGTGLLADNSGDIGEVAYRIHVWLDRKRNVKSADGVVTGDVAILEQAFNRNTLKLRLPSGGVIDLNIEFFGGGTQAEIAIIGPVPRF